VGVIANSLLGLELKAKCLWHFQYNSEIPLFNKIYTNFKQKDSLYVLV